VTKSKDAKKPQKKPPCVREAVEITRGTESERFPLAYATARLRRSPWSA